MICSLYILAGDPFPKHQKELTVNFGKYVGPSNHFLLTPFSRDAAKLFKMEILWNTSEYKHRLISDHDCLLSILIWSPSSR